MIAWQVPNDDGMPVAGEGSTMSRKITNHEVLTRYRDALLARFPDQLQRLILFGSQAAGQFSSMQRSMTYVHRNFATRVDETTGTGRG